MYKGDLLVLLVVAADAEVFVVAAVLTYLLIYVFLSLGFLILVDANDANPWQLSCRQLEKTLQLYRIQVFLGTIKYQTRKQTQHQLIEAMSL